MKLREYQHRFRARYGAASAFLLLALAGGYAINANAEADALRLYTSQVDACERGNILRVQVSRNVSVLDSFLGSAEKARRSAGTPMDIKTADSYANLQGLLKEIDTVDCKRAIPKP